MPSMAKLAVVQQKLIGEDGSVRWRACCRRRQRRRSARTRSRRSCSTALRRDQGAVARLLSRRGGSLEEMLETTRELAAANPGGAYEVRPVGTFFPVPSLRAISARRRST